jgi:hypothetical protein
LVLASVSSLALVLLADSSLGLLSVFLLVFLLD